MRRQGRSSPPGKRGCGAHISLDNRGTAQGAPLKFSFKVRDRLESRVWTSYRSGASGRIATKKALNDQRVATNKIESFTRWKFDLWRTEVKERDRRIFDNHFVPIILQKNGTRLIQLGRYHLRRRGKPPSFDDQYAGLYNARRDNLEKFRTPEFGKTHALMYIESFFENVERDGKKAVAHFVPADGREMIIACLYADWDDPATDGFLSFAAVTDDPPPEVEAAGHNRIIINLDERAIDEWLSPDGKTFAELQQVLDHRSRPYYGHELLAA
jgi:putative SOS response-associated peptidase YedK